jgi:hypothetical protein
VRAGDALAVRARRVRAGKRSLFARGPLEFERVFVQAHALNMQGHGRSRALAPAACGCNVILRLRRE